jgi:hypothetical protein
VRRQQTKVGDLKKKIWDCSGYLNFEILELYLWKPPIIVATARPRAARGLEMSGKLAQIVMSNKTFPMGSSFFWPQKIYMMDEKKKKKGFGFSISVFNFTAHYCSIHIHLLSKSRW